MKDKEITEDSLRFNLVHDWEAEIRILHGEELWDSPNGHTRRIKNMVVTECLCLAKKIKALPRWRRLFNKF